MPYAGLLFYFDFDSGLFMSFVHLSIGYDVSL